MRNTLLAVVGLAFVAMLLTPVVAQDAEKIEAVTAPPPAESVPYEPGMVQAANLIYANNQTSTCFANQFLTQLKSDTLINTHPHFRAVRLDSGEMFEYPFAVMTGSGAFTLPQTQRDNLRRYLERGGFVIASASCSDKRWTSSFRAEVQAVFPDVEMTTLDADHPVFHSVYEITSSKYRQRNMEQLPVLEAIELDGRVVMIFSPDGLNDSSNAGPECCCCGGNEIREARRLNVNILAYALTH